MENVIKIELCGGRMPEKAHADDAAFDVFASADTELTPFSRVAVPLGFRIALPPHLAALVQSRSGMALRGMVVRGLTGTGEAEIRVDADVQTGLIDSGFTGEVHAILHVRGGSLAECGALKTNGVYVKAGTKIAQMRIVYVPRVSLVEGVVSKDTVRGDGGFNSTGV